MSLWINEEVRLYFTFSCYWSVAIETVFPIQLKNGELFQIVIFKRLYHVVVLFAVGQIFLFVVPASVKGPFAIGADKVLGMPRFAESVDDATFDGPPARCIVKEKVSTTSN